MNKLILAALTLTLAACASAPRGAGVTAAPPTYKEKVAPEALSDVKVACPADVGAAETEWRALVPKANACVKAGQWTKVELLGNLIATRAPLAPWGAYFLSLSASSRGDFARAQWMLELALKKAPDQPIFHFELGRLYWQLGDEAGVMKEMKTAATESPELTDAHVFMGQVALRRADLGEARRELRTALTAEPENKTALLALAQVELTAADYAAAEDALTKAIKVAPRHAEARLALAQVQETHLKKTPEALETLREIAKLAEQRKLDGQAPTGLNERIKTLEKTLSQVKRDDKLSQRQPSAERQVTK